MLLLFAVVVCSAVAACAAVGGCGCDGSPGPASRLREQRAHGAIISTSTHNDTHRENTRCCCTITLAHRGSRPCTHRPASQSRGTRGTRSAAPTRRVGAEICHRRRTRDPSTGEQRTHACGFQRGMEQLDVDSYPHTAVVPVCALSPLCAAGCSRPPPPLTLRCADRQRPARRRVRALSHLQRTHFGVLGLQ